MYSSQEVLFLRNVNGESKWINIGYEKIWIRLFWKIFTNGKYVGEFKDGKKNGQGVLTYSNGSKYVGEFQDGKKHGQGIITSPEGSQYEGVFKDGKFHGKGALFRYDKSGQPCGKFERGLFKDGKFVKYGKI